MRQEAKSIRQTFLGVVATLVILGLPVFADAFELQTVNLSASGAVTFNSQFSSTAEETMAGNSVTVADFTFTTSDVEDVVLKEISFDINYVGEGTPEDVFLNCSLANNSGLVVITTSTKTLKLNTTLGKGTTRQESLVCTVQSSTYTPSEYQWHIMGAKVTGASSNVTPPCESSGNTLTCKSPEINTAVVSDSDPKPEAESQVEPEPEQEPEVVLPTCSLSITPSTIIEGDSATLSWGSEHAVSAQISNIGDAALSGSEVVHPLSDTTYTAVFRNGNQSTVCSAAVSVTPQTVEPVPEPEPQPEPQTQQQAVTESQNSTLPGSTDESVSGTVSNDGNGAGMTSKPEPQTPVTFSHEPRSTDSTGSEDNTNTASGAQETAANNLSASSILASSQDTPSDEEEKNDLLDEEMNNATRGGATTSALLAAEENTSTSGVMEKHSTSTPKGLFTAIRTSITNFFGNILRFFSFY